jgi:NCS1 family nucleobase:cation symporter-1
VIATALGVLIAVGGAYSTVGPDGVKTGPFPSEGVIPILKPLYDFNWVVAFLVAMVAYWLLATHKGQNHKTVPFDPPA